MITTKKIKFIKIFFSLFIFEINGGAIATPNLTTNGDFESLYNQSGFDFCYTAHNSRFFRNSLFGWNSDNIYSPCFNLAPTSTWRKRYMQLRELPEYGANKNSIGVQAPQSGKTYALLMDLFDEAFVSLYPHSRGGLINKLQTRLVAGARYDVSFYASFPELMRKAYRLGLYFLSDQEKLKATQYAWGTSVHDYLTPFLADTRALPIRTGVMSKDPVTDRTQWTQIAGSYVADGKEENVLIGNLHDDPSKFQYEPTNCSDPDFCLNSNQEPEDMNLFSGYFVDNVSVNCGDNAVDFKGTPSPVKLNRCDATQFNSYLLQAKGDQYGIDVLSRQNNSWTKVKQYLPNPASKTSWTLTELGLDLKSIPVGGHYKFKSTYNTCMGDKIEPEKEITIEDIFMGTAKFSMNGDFSNVIKSNICHDDVIVAPEISSEASTVEFTIYHEKNPALKIVVPGVKQGESFSIYSLPKPQGWIWDTDTYVIEMKFSVACPATPVVITKKMILSNAFSMNWVIEKTKGLTGDFIQFDDLSLDWVKRKWSISGPGVSIIDQQKKLHPQFLNAGTFQVKLEIFGKESCHQVNTETIEIFDAVDKNLIFIPNAFSPRNDDGINERFHPKGQYFFYELKVFNTYGEKIYESPAIEDPNDTTRDLGWDGYYQGKVAPQGAYQYQVRIFDQLGRPVAYPPGGVVHVL